MERQDTATPGRVQSRFTRSGRSSNPSELILNHSGPMAIERQESDNSQSLRDARTSGASARDLIMPLLEAQRRKVKKSDRFTMNPLKKFATYGRPPCKLLLSCLLFTLVALQIFRWEIQTISEDQGQRLALITSFMPDGYISPADDPVERPTYYFFTADDVLSQLETTTKNYYTLVRDTVGHYNYLLERSPSRHLDDIGSSSSTLEDQQQQQPTSPSTGEPKRQQRRLPFRMRAAAKSPSFNGHKGDSGDNIIPPEMVTTLQTRSPRIAHEDQIASSDTATPMTLENPYGHFRNARQGMSGHNVSKAANYKKACSPRRERAFEQDNGEEMYYVPCRDENMFYTIFDGVEKVTVRFQLLEFTFDQETKQQAEYTWHVRQMYDFMDGGICVLTIHVVNDVLHPELQRLTPSVVCTLVLFVLAVWDLALRMRSHRRINAYLNKSVERAKRRRTRKFRSKSSLSGYTYGSDVRGRGHAANTPSIIGSTKAAGREDTPLSPSREQVEDASKGPFLPTSGSAVNVVTMQVPDTVVREAADTTDDRVARDEHGHGTPTGTATRSPVVVGTKSADVSLGAKKTRSLKKRDASRASPATTQSSSSSSSSSSEKRPMPQRRGLSYASIASHRAIQLQLLTKSRGPRDAYERMWHKDLKRHQTGLSWVYYAVFNDIVILFYTVLRAGCAFWRYDSFELIYTRLMLVGLCGITSATSLVSYFRYFPKLYFMIRATNAAMPHLLSFAVAVLPVFFGYTFFGVIVFGSFASEYQSFVDSASALYSAFFGDTLLPTFQQFPGTRHWLILQVANVFEYSFVALFMWAVLNIALAIVVDAYIHIRQSYGLFDDMDTSMVLLQKSGQLQKRYLIEDVELKMMMLLLLMSDDEDESEEDGEDAARTEQLIGVLAQAASERESVDGSVSETEGVDPTRGIDEVPSSSSSSSSSVPSEYEAGKEERRLREKRMLREMLRSRSPGFGSNPTTPGQHAGRLSPHYGTHLGVRSFYSHESITEHDTNSLFSLPQQHTRSVPQLPASVAHRQGQINASYDERRTKHGGGGARW